MDETLVELARKQWGVFSRSQALAHGVTRSGIGRRLRSGTWERFDNDVYCYPAGVVSWHQKVMAATLAVGPGCMASHLTAAWLWDLELRGGAPILLEVLVPRGVGRHTTRAKRHRSRRCPEPVLREGIRTTPLVRTLLDLGETMHDKELFRLIDSARRKHGDILGALAQEATVNGLRKAPPRIGRLLSQMSALRPTESPLEGETLFELLCARGLPPPVPQFEIFDDHRRFIARVDFAWVPQRVVLMSDSHTWHLDRDAWEHDVEQRSRLQANGWRVFGVTKRMMRRPRWLDDLARLLGVGVDRPGKRA